MDDGDVSILLDFGTASDLISLEQARSFLQKESTSTSQDDEISSMITRASVAIMSYTEREFTPETVAELRTFEGYYGSQGLFVDFAPYDLQSATIVQIDTDQASPITLNAIEYRLGPLPSKYGVYTHLRMRPLRRSLGQIIYPQVQVKVTGTWGFPSVPEDVQMACLVTVATWMRREVQGFERVLNIDQNTVERPLVLPSAVLGMLAPYKRMAI